MNLGQDIQLLLQEDVFNGLTVFQTAMVLQAWNLFALFAALELVSAAFIIVVFRRSIDSALLVLLRRVAVLSVVFTALFLMPQITKLILEGFQYAAALGPWSDATLNPFEIIRKGNLFLTLLVDPGDSWAAFFGIPFRYVMAYAFWATFAFIAITILVVQIEAAVLVATSPFFWVFGAFHRTARIADNFVSFAAQIATKLFFLYLMVFFGTNIVSQAIESYFDLLQSEAGASNTFELVAGPWMLWYFLLAVLWLILVVKIPGYFANKLISGWTPGIAAAYQDK